MLTVPPQNVGAGGLCGGISGGRRSRKTAVAECPIDLGWFGRVHFQRKGGAIVALAS